MGLTREDIATRAFTLIGGEVVTDFATPNNRETIIANQLYEELVTDEISSYPWTMAKQQEVLSRETDTDAGTNIPDHEWSAIYRLSPSAIAIRGLYVQGNSINFEIFGDRVYCNAVAADEVVSEHLIRADETVWFPYFRMAMIYKLASDFGGALARDADLVTAFEEKYLYQLRRAKAMDSQSETTDNVKTNKLILVRR